MKVSIQGKLIDCVNTKSADKKKDYFSLNVYSEGQMFRVGVPLEVYSEYSNHINEDIELEDINLWVEGKYSLYIKG